MTCAGTEKRAVQFRGACLSQIPDESKWGAKSLHRPFEVNKVIIDGAAEEKQALLVLLHHVREEEVLAA